MSPSTQTATVSPALQRAGQLDALLHAAGVAPLDDLGWLRVTGSDRVRWLNGMVTNSITDLQPGEGNYNFVLSAQGRIQATAFAFAQPESILLQTNRAQLPHMLATLDRFIIMDDVELADITGIFTGLTVIGPTAAAALESIGLATPATGAITTHECPWHGSDVKLIAAHSPLVTRYELWAMPATIAALHEALLEAGAVPCTPEALEHLRLLEGTPRYGTDIRDKELPQETAQAHALHFAKGCYLGQEIVERIRSRGAVHRTFAAFRLDGALPAPGTAIAADGKHVGELTSVAAIPFAAGLQQIALGYIRREALTQPLTYPGGTAIPVPLPIRQP